MRKLSLAVILVPVLSGCFAYGVREGELGQNWNVEDQRSFYGTSQGSQLLKYDWFLALEQVSNDRLFLEDSMQRFGYLPNPFAASQSSDNSHLLPIGFVEDVGTGYIDGQAVAGPWIGMTCAACHTAEMQIGAKKHLIDGAPTNADFYAFIKALSDSLAATVSDANKFTRFEMRVDGGSSLRAELERTANRFEVFVAQSTPEHAWGKARLDAVGLILNSIAHRLVPQVNSNNSDADYRDDKLGHLRKRNPDRPNSDNTHQPDAPVSYPFLWDTFQQTQNQWNGVSVGTLSRNTTEVLGVFATFDADKPRKNSVRFAELKKLQALVANLRSPHWENPAYALPPIDRESAARGKEFYKAFCQNCHAVLERDDDQVKEVAIVLNGFEAMTPGSAGFQRPKPELLPEVSVGTDPAMATNFVDHTFATKKDKQLIHAKDVIGEALTKIWFKSIFGALLYGGIEEIVNNLFSKITSDLEVYKARPLNGIWATAPYLHNGSVPNMEELLKPPDERAKIFCVGSRVFETDTLGFNSALDKAGSCGNNFTFDTQWPGNRNIGHDSYGDLSPEVRLDIIEFIKTE